MKNFWDFCAPFYDIAEKVNGQAYDKMLNIVVAGQVLHLIDEPIKAACELKRVAKSMVILPMSFTKNLCGTAKLGVDLYHLFGFAPKIEFTSNDYVLFPHQYRISAAFFR